MQFERLRKNHKKQIIIGAIAICVIGGALTFNLTRAKYKIANDLELAKGTINYKAYDFKIMAMYKSDDKTNYTEIEEMPESDYVINEEKTYCTTDNKTQIKGKIKTENGKHYISGLSKNDKCYLYFDKCKIPTASETILSNIQTKSTIPNFSKSATEDEGVYKASDGMYGGTSYYWRGAATTNYVLFNEFCWRIIRINGDNSIRLIYDGTTCHENGTVTDNNLANSSKYNSNILGAVYVGYTYSEGYQRPNDNASIIFSNLKSQTESWFNNNILSKNINKISDGKFCNNRNFESGKSWSNLPGEEIYFESGFNLNKFKPTLSCPAEDVYILKAGAITADEVVMAGNNFSENNTFYLYNGKGYWTMTPYNIDKNGNVYVFYLHSWLSTALVNGNGSTRPVINLRSDVTFSGGNGTLDNPYIVE